MSEYAISRKTQFLVSGCFPVTSDWLYLYCRALYYPANKVFFLYVFFSLTGPFLIQITVGLPIPFGAISSLSYACFTHLLQMTHCCCIEWVSCAIFSAVKWFGTVFSCNWGCKMSNSAAVYPVTQLALLNTNVVCWDKKTSCDFPERYPWHSAVTSWLVDFGLTRFIVMSSNLDLGNMRCKQSHFHCLSGRLQKDSSIFRK